jgi:hypothetical protein
MILKVTSYSFKELIVYRKNIYIDIRLNCFDFKRMNFCWLKGTCICFRANNNNTIMHLGIFTIKVPKSTVYRKRTTKDHFGFLLHLLLHGYSGLMYDYN